MPKLARAWGLAVLGDGAKRSAVGSREEERRKRNRFLENEQVNQREKDKVHAMIALDFSRYTHACCAIHAHAAALETRQREY